MRVLVVDQDSTSNLAIARSLRDRYTVDAVSTKADCLDLLRANAFEVIVAGERLEDGSGLELLGQVAKRWPGMLRIFAADRHRLKLLKGRLGPFGLFQTLAYPIDSDRLIATLTLAESAQDAHADTSNIQHVELSSEHVELSPEHDEVSEDESADPELGSANADPFPPPRPEPRVAPESSAAQPTRDHPRSSGGHRTRHPMSPAPGMTRAAPPGRLRPPDHTRSGAHTRSRARPSPVKFPPIERPQTASATPSFLGGGALRRLEPPLGSIASAVALAREASPNPVGLREEAESRRAAFLIGGAVVAAVAVVLFGFRLFAPKHAAPTPVAAQVESSQPNPPAVPDPGQPVAQHSEEAKAKIAPAPRKHGDPGRGSTRVASAETETKAPASEVSSTPPATGVVQPSHSATQSLNNHVDDGSALPPETPAGMTLAAAPTVQTAPPSTAPAVTTSTAPAVPALTAPVVPALTAPVVPASTAPAPPGTASSAGPVRSRLEPSDEPPPVIREAKLIHRVDAEYPSAAKRTGLVGSVDLDVTVSQQGAVKSVTVAHADPPDVFDKSAVAAVRKWKYDPEYVDGLPVDAHVKVHLDFKPE